MFVILPSWSSLLSLVTASASSWMPNPNRSVSSLCLKEMTVGLGNSITFPNCMSSSDRSERSSSLTGNPSWEERRHCHTSIKRIIMRRRDKRSQSRNRVNVLVSSPSLSGVYPMLQNQSLGHPWQMTASAGLQEHRGPCPSPPLCLGLLSSCSVVEMVALLKSESQRWQQQVGLGTRQLLKPPSVLWSGSQIWNV